MNKIIFVQLNVFSYKHPVVVLERDILKKHIGSYTIDELPVIIQNVANEENISEVLIGADNKEYALMVKAQLNTNIQYKKLKVEVI